MPIGIQDLVVHRGATVAIDRVGVEIENGCWTGVVGANGSGKTSLLRAIAGRLESSGGRIVVDECDRTADRSWRARAFGFAPDIASLPQTLTGAELFSIIASEIPGSAGDDPLSGLRHALDFEGILDRTIGTLSAGMRQRLAIFCAFLHRPRVVILDEPFNWLDPVCAFDTKEALRSLVASDALTLVTALHEMSTLTHYCGAGVLLSNGRVSRLLGAQDLAAGARDYAAFESEVIRGMRSACALG